MNAIIITEAVSGPGGLLQVRRAALRHQLELDYRQYQAELRDQGKAFYFQRI